jgi:hypothetical protein
MTVRFLASAALLGLAFTTAGCVSDLSLPNDPKLICAADADCPNGLKCNSGHVCVPSSFVSQPAPDLQTTPAVTPAAGKSGTTFSIKVLATQPMRGGPTVTLHLTPAVIITGCNQEGDDRLTYTCQYTATGQENGSLGGVVPFDVSIENDLRVVTEKAYAGSLTLDFTAPTAVPWISPPTAVLGQTPVVSLLLSEPMPSAPGIIVLGADNNPVTTLHFNAAQLSATTLSYTLDHAIATSDHSGVYTLVTSLTDFVGNTTPNVKLGQLTIAAGIPHVSNANVDTSIDEGGIRGNTFSAVPGFNQVKVDFDTEVAIDTPPATYDVIIGGRVVPHDLCHVTSATPDGATAPVYSASCLFTLTPSMLAQDGLTPLSSIEAEQEPILINVVDAVGNEGRGAPLPVIFDLRKPSIVAHSGLVSIAGPAGSILLHPSAMTIGSVATVDFSVSEPLRFDPGVATESNVLVFQKGASTGTALEYTATLTQTGVDGTYAIETILTDEAGNESDVLSITDAGLVIDTAAPDAPSVGNAMTYTRAPWGRLDGFAPSTDPSFTVTGGANAVEANAWVRFFDGPDRSTATLIAQTERQADDTGAFGTVGLTPVDRNTVYVGAEDEAGNASPLVPVKNVQWIGSLNGTLSTAVRTNPTLVLSTPTFAPTMDPENYQATEVTPGLTAVSVPSHGVWRQGALGSQSPSARAGAALAYDLRRGVTVMVGGDDANGPQSDTWEWNGSTWTKRAVAGPSARTHAASAYDARHGTVVVFGGWSSGGELNDTWTYDGLQWARWRTPSGAGVPPSPRRDALLAYDAERGSVILFGGRSGTNAFSDVYEFDGSSWTQISPSGTPPARSAGSFTYIPKRVDSAGATVSQERFIAFGGVDGTGTDLQDTWELVPTPTTTGWSWSKRSSTGPAIREQQAAFFNPTTLAVTVVGGKNSSGTLSDVWSWNGNTWTQLTVTGQPSGRYAATSTYDAARGEALLFGGTTTGGNVGDLWAYSALRWTNVTPSAPPTALQGQAVAYEEAHSQTVLFGGTDGSGAVQGSTWLWNGRRWSQPTLTTQPPARTNASLAYDRVRSRFVLFGGLDVAGHPLSDTWEWDGAASAWSPITPSGSVPTARSLAGLGFYCAKQGSTTSCDPATAVVLLVGGVDGSGNTLRETWAWNGTTWTSKNPTRDSRSRISLAFDTTRFRTVLFGGLAGSTASTVANNETFEWNGTDWLRVAAATSPSARSGQALAFDSSRGRVVLFGGLDSTGQALQDDWFWDGNTWTADLRLCIAGLPQQGLCDSAGNYVTSVPPGRSLSGGAYDTLRRHLVVFGGAALTSTLGDTWELSYDPLSTPAVLVTFDFASTGSTGVPLSAWTPSAIIGGTGSNPGATLYAWDFWAGAWVSVGANAASASTAGAIVPATTLVSAARIIGSDGLIHLAAVPLNGQGNLGPGLVTVNNVQVALSYNIP